MRMWFWKQIGKFARSKRGMDYFLKRDGEGKFFGWRWRLHWQHRPHRREEVMMFIGAGRVILLEGWMGVESPGPHWPQQKHSIIFNRANEGDHINMKDGGTFKITQVPRGGCLSLIIYRGPACMNR